MGGIAPKIGGGGADTSLEEIASTALGFATWTHDPQLCNGGTAPTAGTIYVRSMPFRSGQVVTNLVFQVSTAAAGTVPTDIFVGLSDSTGKMLVQSATLKSSAIWTPGAGSGLAIAPLIATYQIPTDGLYYAVFLQVGAWGTTQLVLGKAINNIAPGSLGGLKGFGTAGTTQTALPANGSSLVIVTANGISYFAAAS